MSQYCLCTIVSPAVSSPLSRPVVTLSIPINTPDSLLYSVVIIPNQFTLHWCQEWDGREEDGEEDEEYYLPQLFHPPMDHDRTTAENQPAVGQCRGEAMSANLRTNRR